MDCLKSSIFVFVICLSLSTIQCFPNERVVNGSDTTVNEYPYIISLRGRSGSHSCGGSIIGEKWVLTAAHCVDGAKAVDLSVQYAVTQINSAGPNVVPVKRIIVHEKYNPDNSYANDIALLELTGSFTFNYKTLAPVTLPEPNYEIPQTPEGLPGKLAGWGRNGSDVDGIVQRTLQEVDLKIYSDAECRARHNGRTTTDHICGGVDDGWKGQCNGDSGGPLVTRENVQVGIVSWSIKPCTTPPFPGVYTKLSHFITWVRLHTV